MFAAVFELPLRIAAFAVGFFFYWMETGADWIIGVPNKTEFVRTGACKRCGRCCRLLALEMPMAIAKRDRLVDFLSWWHKVLFNFQFKGRDGKWLIYRCGYFADGERPGCRIYRFRHRLCRFYPKQPLYGHPKTHADCGFKFVRRDTRLPRLAASHGGQGKPTFDEVLEQKRKIDISD